MYVKSNSELNVMFPHPPGAGGPGSFQIRFEKELLKNGWTISYAGTREQPDLVFVVGGTRKLFWLWRMRLKKIPIVYRLDGISWLHKKGKIKLKNYFLAESRNWMSKSIHAFLADKIVYQSRFVQGWWDKKGWRVRKNTSVVYNGVVIQDKKLFDKSLSSRNTKRLVILEGVIDYSPYAVKLLNDLAQNLPQDIQIELYGKFEKITEKNKLNQRLQYKGFLDRADVYAVMSGAVYLSLDINPACPNTVAEALACGAPVVAFDTGALPELVDESCGKVVAYGSNPWDLEYPDVFTLMQSITHVFEGYDAYSNAASRKAIENYTLETMFEKYASALEYAMKKNK